MLAHIVSYAIYESINNETESEKNFSKLLATQKGDFAFAIRLFVNCLGYGCIFTPLFLIYKYTTKIKYVERGGKFSFVTIIVKMKVKYYFFRQWITV